MTALNRRRILIIDDQEAIHDDYRKIICPVRPSRAAFSAVESQLFGDESPADEPDDLYEVDSAFQGRDAVALVEKALIEGRPYAVAFVDIRMPPGWDGVQTVREIWAIDPEILIVLCSAYSDYSWEDIVQQLGRTDRFLILRKPFDNVEVRQCAAALTERWVIARVDPLTGLLNRRSFEEHLRREWAYSLRDERGLACVLLDLDFFKSINDRFGHAAGDDALKSISQLLGRQIRPGDIVCRYGGEEFCVLLPNTDENTAYSWAEQLRQTVADMALDAGPHRIQLTASFGIATRTGNIFRQEDLLRKADDALRAAKLAGRNRVVSWAELNRPEEESPRLRRYAMVFEGLLARDIMSSPITCVNETMTIAEAAELFLHQQINSAPVIHEDGTLAGIVTEKDIMEGLGHADGWNAPVSQIMTARVLQYEPETKAELIFEFLSRVQLHRVVIVKGDKPIGFVSRESFLRWIQNYVKVAEPCDAPLDARPKLLQTADALTDRAQLLRDELAGDPDEVVTPVVNGVSSLQGIINELLSWARCSQTHSNSREYAGTP
jgi:diguanylate cyclase (GGDEF)-like protein